MTLVLQVLAGLAVMVAGLFIGVSSISLPYGQGEGTVILAAMLSFTGFGLVINWR